MPSFGGSSIYSCGGTFHARLEHSPDLGLSVPYGKFESGAPVILSNVTVAGENNKFRLNVLGLHHNLGRCI
jgi:hypothetical protein